MVTGNWVTYYCFSVAKLCLILCDPIDCSMPGFPVLHHLQSLTDSCPLNWWCHLTISSSVIPFFSCLQSFPASGSFPVSWLFALGGQTIGVSASTSVLPGNIQGWFPLGLTGLISLHSGGFSSTITFKHQGLLVRQMKFYSICSIFASYLLG